MADSLIPGYQISTDDFAGALANQTNLAIKGIIGIRAMGEMAGLAGNIAESANYTVRARASPGGRADEGRVCSPLRRTMLGSGRALRRRRMGHI